MKAFTFKSTIFFVQFCIHYNICPKQGKKSKATLHGRTKELKNRYAMKRQNNKTGFFNFIYLHDKENKEQNQNTY